MSLKCQVVLVWIICLPWNLILTSCEVVLVNRNVTDSFRVGEDGCKNDTSVCKSNAVCQSDGSCLCKSETVSYRNPVLKFKESEIVYDNSYGCIDNEIIRFGSGKKSNFCYFSPFQVIPYSSNQPATEFSYDISSRKLHNCSLLNAWVKFPDNETEKKLPWLNESYINFTVLNNKTIYFRWKRSGYNLQGTIITFNLICNNISMSSIFTCIRAKVFGTWPTDVDPASTTEPTATSFLRNTTSSVSTEPKETTSSSTSSLEEESSESNTLNAALVALLAVSLFVNAVFGIIMGFLWKKLQRIKDNNLKMTDIQNIQNQERTNFENGVHNDFIYEESFPQSGHDNNNASLSDHNYEEPSNYEPLRRNHLQDQSNGHNYQSLTTSHEGK